MPAVESLTLFRLDQLRQSVKGYRELERAAAEFRGRAAIGLAARVLVAQRQSRVARLAATELNRHANDAVLHYFADESGSRRLPLNC